MRPGYLSDSCVASTRPIIILGRFSPFAVSLRFEGSCCAVEDWAPCLSEGPLSDLLGAGFPIKTGWSSPFEGAPDCDVPVVSVGDSPWLSEEPWVIWPSPKTSAVSTVPLLSEVISGTSPAGTFPTVSTIVARSQPDMASIEPRSPASGRPRLSLFLIAACVEEFFLDSFMCGSRHVLTLLLTIVAATHFSA